MTGVIAALEEFLGPYRLVIAATLVFACLLMIAVHYRTRPARRTHVGRHRRHMHP